MKTTILFRFTSALIFSLLFVLPALAKEKPSLIRVPVFFITDRNLVPAKDKSDAVVFGPHRKYIDQCKHDPYMGTAYCVVSNVEKTEITPDLKALGWTEAAPTDKEAMYKADIMSAESFDGIEKTFYDKLHQEALLTPDKNIFLFAHGYKNSFASGLHTAAKMAYYAHRPLIYYSWPSVCAFRSYTSDENNVEWSQEHFNHVVEQLDALCTNDPAVKVRLFSHSMGTRLIVRACPLLKEKPWLAEGVMICPDVDDGLVKHYASRYLSNKGTATIRIYMSQRDKALAISQIVHGGYCRFGECADSIAGMANNIFTSNEKSKEDDPELAAILEKTKHRMQTIDFTDLDFGILGHKVPAAVICSMSFTNTPGPGLKLVPEESGERSKLSQRLSKMTKLRTDKEMTIKGTCLRVVKDSQPTKKKEVATTLDDAQAIK